MSIEKEARFGVWVYYTNDENKARWKCSVCGKVCKHNPFYKYYCSNCGCHMRMEA
jgi:ABC-type ATPase with predicted acetyltransferase domain